MANPAVRVSPTREAPTHDVSLSDGAETIGLQFLNDLRTNILQEIPISPPSRPYSTRQKSWFGGSRRLNFSDDPNGFYESHAMWTMTDGKLFPRPIERFAKGHRDAEYVQPGSMTFMDMMPGVNTYISRLFTASATGNRRQVFLWLNYVGEPGDLTISIYSDTAGSPNAAVQSTTLSTTTANIYGWNVVNLAANVAVTSGTDYHVVVKCASTDNDGNHWMVGVSTTGSASKTSTDGTNWSAATYSLYYRVTTPPVKRQWFHFQLYGAEYKVSANDNASGSVLMINGDRGRATSGTASTLTDTSSGVSAGWTTDQWVGCKIRIINGAGDGQIRTILSNTATAITVSEDWDVNPGATSEYVIYDTDQWQVISGHGLTECKSVPAVANNIVYFPQGSGVNIRMMHIDYTDADVHAFADDGTNKAGFLTAYYDPDKGLQLWKANYGAASMSYATPVSWGSSNTYTAITGTYVGTSDKNITNVLAREALYVWKEDSLWKIVKGRPVQVNSGMEYAPSPFNGKGAVAANNEMWWGWNHSLVRMIGGSISDMMAFRQGWQGLPPDRQGIPVSGANAGAWWFFGLDGMSSDRSTILCWNGYGFMELFRGWAINQRIQNIYWLAGPEARPKLYFDTGGESMYIEFPMRNSNPLNDTGLSYQPFAEIVTTTFDANEPALEKALNKLSMLVYGGGSRSLQGRIKVYFQVDDEIAPVAKRGATWHYAGEITGSRNVRTLKAAEVEINFGQINRYRLKFEVFCQSATNPIVILGIEHFGDIFTPLQYRWVGTFKVDSNQLTHNGDPDFSPDFILDFLRRAHEDAKMLRMRSIIPNMDDVAVVVANAPVPVYLWVRPEDGKAKWGGYITVGLKEPG